MAFDKIWITGAGKGIGRALALAFCRKGAEVIASARTESDLASLAAEAEALAGRIHAIPLDVTDHEAVLAAFARAEEHAGPLDLVILNAGQGARTEPADIDVRTYRALMDVNYMGVIHGLAAAVPVFAARRSGRVAIVSSLAGYRGLPFGADYSATKAALINLAESLRPGLEAAGVGITVINPGYVRSNMTGDRANELPFLVEAEDAARRIVRGLERGRFEIAFPRPLVWLARLGQMLPYPLYFMIARQFAARTARPDPSGGAG